MLNYTVNLIPDEETQSIIVEFPDISFCHSVGDDEDEALLNALDAIESALEIYFDEKRPVPMPSMPAPGQAVVHLPALITAKCCYGTKCSLRAGAWPHWLAWANA